ncbi:MAG: N-6 DNA methylase [Pirellulales bacterium]|nr:N-6 DNA methylase [Pirellulales bacterium]
MEFGDFQTPLSLAKQICSLLVRQGCQPASIIEPTCGRGSFLLAALEHFPRWQTVLGVDVNAQYVHFLETQLCDRPGHDKIHLAVDNFFKRDWATEIERLPKPLLVLGNPPWVTNATLGSLGGKNLPKKSNHKNLNGLDAITGKSNFDISEWMLLEMLKWLNGREATLAMLCKTGVARKILQEAWKQELHLETVEIREVDAAKAFQAAVDACLLICKFCPQSSSRHAEWFSSLEAHLPRCSIGIHQGRFVADLPRFQKWEHLAGRSQIQWRSGIKHDCAKIMELQKEGARYRNGLHDLWEMEEEYLYPLLKSSDLAHRRIECPRKWLLVPQRFIGEDTLQIRESAPKTWNYLKTYIEHFNRRTSSIYRNRPPFSLFGVGEYSFAPAKVAISALHKKLDFIPLGRYARKPMVLDDTCYFLPCSSIAQAESLALLLNSSPAQKFLGSLIFWDAKRPITIEILQQLDLNALARELGKEATYLDCVENPFPKKRADLQKSFSFPSV